jgi:hypothetical protein
MSDSFAAMPPFLNLWFFSATKFGANFSRDWVRDTQRYQRKTVENWLAFLQSCTPDFRPSVEVLPPLASLSPQDRRTMPFLKRV